MGNILLLPKIYKLQAKALKHYNSFPPMTFTKNLILDFVIHQAYLAVKYGHRE